MKRWITIVLLLSACVASAQIDHFRAMYFGAQDASGRIRFLEATATADEKDALQLAYKGVATAMQADVVGGIDEKFSVFNQGKSLIETAISRAPWDPEIRFLRFSVQAEVPWIVNYSGNEEEDAQVILEALWKRTADPSSEFWRKAISYMLGSGELSAPQEREFRKFGS